MYLAKAEGACVYANHHEAASPSTFGTRCHRTALLKSMYTGRFFQSFRGGCLLHALPEYAKNGDASYVLPIP